jgi:hypothetical protein
MIALHIRRSSGNDDAERIDEAGGGCNCCGCNAGINER